MRDAPTPEEVAESTGADIELLRRAREAVEDREAEDRSDGEMKRLRAGYAGEFAVECPECGRDMTFADPQDRSGTHPNVEITYHEETRAVCGENSITGGCGVEFTVTGFDVTVTPIKECEDQ